MLVKNTITRLSIAIMLILLGSDYSKAQVQTKKSPNIIIILADDLGYKDLHAYGNSSIRTPNIDALGKTGTRFTQAYSTAAICSPSRAALITGRYQQRFGFEYLAGSKNIKITPEFLKQYQAMFASMRALGQQQDTTTYPAGQFDGLPKGLPATETSLATLLKQKGYSTGIVGKWHLGDEEYNPLRHGFDYQYGFLGGSGLYAPEHSNGVVDYHLPWCFSDAPGWQRSALLGSDILRNNIVIDEKGYLTTRIGEEAVSFIDKNKSKPFFLYVPFNAPHDPFQALQSDFDSYANISDTTKRVYYAMITAMDRAIGQIVGQLKKNNIDQETIIFFASDNGGATYTRATDNAPLKGGKLSVFEGGFRVPFYVVYPGKVPAGAVYDKPVSLLDVFSTTAAAAKIALPKGRDYDGVNLVPYLNNSVKTPPHNVLYWRSGFNKAIRKGNYKLYVNLRINKIFLYDLAKDVSEKSDIATQFPAKVQELKNDLKAWESKLKTPNWPNSASYLLDVDGEKYPFPL